MGINSDFPGSVWIQADVHCAMSDESREIWTHQDTFHKNLQSTAPD